MSEKRRPQTTVAHAGDIRGNSRLSSTITERSPADSSGRNSACEEMRREQAGILESDKLCSPGGWGTTIRAQAIYRTKGKTGRTRLQATVPLHHPLTTTRVQAEHCGPFLAVQPPTLNPGSTSQPASPPHAPFLLRDSQEQIFYGILLDLLGPPGRAGLIGFPALKSFIPPFPHPFSDHFESWYPIFPALIIKSDYPTPGEKGETGEILQNPHRITRWLDM